MADLDWHDFYAIGIDFIDAEHKHILSILRSMQEAIIGCDTEQTYHLSEQLITDCMRHFKNEEEFLCQVEYPELEQHNHYHNGLLVQANRIRDVCRCIDTDHDLMVCFDEMKKFMIDDIMYGDIKFKSYLEYKGLIDRKY